jgi:radical SAM protein with 4Fe4S-binding SPASM domain
MERSDARPPDAGVENERLNQREMQAGATVLASKPTRAWLSVTGKCNLLCTHCPRSLVDEQYLSSAEMQPSVFERVKREVLPSLRLLRIGGNNLGEQLFAKGWNSYAQGLKDGQFTPWLITNGQTLNRTRIADLVRAGYVIDVSIDAATEAKYRQIRGASLAKLVENVRAIVEERDAAAAEPSNGRAAKVMFSFTAFADNVEELPALVRLAADLRVDEVVVTHYMPSLEGQRYQSLFYHQQSANAAFDAARAIARERGLTLQLPPNYRVQSLGHEQALQVRVKDRYGRLAVASPDEKTPPCAHPWTSVSIDEKGQVFPCCQSNLLMGDLRTSSFDEIWNNRRYRKLRQTVNTSKPLPDCRRCVLRGATFTSVDCDEPSFFLRNLELPILATNPRHAQLRDWFAKSTFGRRMWNIGRAAYKNFFEWHFAR